MKREKKKEKEKEGERRRSCNVVEELESNKHSLSLCSVLLFKWPSLSPFLVL